MGNVSIDFSLNNIWESWFKFIRGKKKTKELDYFQYHLEENLRRIHLDLNKGAYRHGHYRYFVLQDNKRRDIFVASIRDRIVHRLAYGYLVKIYDKTFIYDVWSCRKRKGLLGAIERTQKFLKKYSQSFVWRADIAKFFNNVKTDILQNILGRRIKDGKAIWLIEEIIKSSPKKYERESKMPGLGIPIGNLTSQIFANIYLNELDRFVKHILKPQFYLRYGDDFIIIAKTRISLIEFREKAAAFLRDSLGLAINHKNDIILPVKKGVYFLGVEIYPVGRRLKERCWKRAKERLSLKNIASYNGLIKQHSKEKIIKEFNWRILEKMENEIIL